MMSSYFYPASQGGEARPKADELGNRIAYEPPRQLSLLDWMMQRTEIEPYVTEKK